MAIMAKSTGADFERELPPVGLHRAVCVDVEYLGWEESAFKNEDGSTKTQEKVRLVWELDPESAGEHSHFENPFRISNKYTLSIHDKANLTKDLVSWRGRKFTEEEKKGFDLEQVLNASGLINVVHNESKDGSTWANIGAIMPLQKGQDKLEPSGAYVRVINRPTKSDNGQADQPEHVEDGFGNDDSLPF